MLEIVCAIIFIISIGIRTEERNLKKKKRRRGSNTFLIKCGAILAMPLSMTGRTGGEKNKKELSYLNLL